MSRLAVGRIAAPLARRPRAALDWSRLPRRFISGLEGTPSPSLSSLPSPAPIEQDLPLITHEHYDQETSATEQPHLPSFHEISSGGYNGQLARAYQGGDRVRSTLAIMDTMRRAGQRPGNIQTYNYLLAALLESGARRTAFHLLRDLEARGLVPDIFTFEVLMGHFAGESVMAVTVDELFHLMQIKYGLVPSSYCWSARLRAWMGRANEQRVLLLLRELQERGGRAAKDPALFAAVARVAYGRSHWAVLEETLALLRGPARIQLTSPQWFSIWMARYDRLVPQAVPYARQILAQLECFAMDEGCYVRILYFAAVFGDAAADLALLALSKLSILYAQDGAPGRPAALPRSYLEAFVRCVRHHTTPDWALPGHSLESAMERPDSTKYTDLCSKIESLLHPPA